MLKFSHIYGLINSPSYHFDPRLLQILFDSFHTREAFKHLQRIHFFESSKCEIATIIIITINTIRPLLHLSHLWSVEFGTRSSIWIDNDDLKKMAKAWPRLEGLYLNESYGCRNPTPAVTIPGLVEFVDLCPRLTTLAVGSITLAV
ncbi:hypothetical protein DFH29DRAFT_954277 [Suillus ampliporus]|nr:hypothetical protein DFH29DRAFT_954277 [Suillus ampliporus]